MADLIEQLQDRETRDLNRQLALADHNNSWSQTFHAPRSSEALRASQNYEELKTRAIERKQQLLAQTDPKQQALYFASRLQPLKEELEKEKIEHQAASTLAAGASTRFNQRKDKETMGHVVGFADHMERAPDVGTPEYAKHVLDGVKRFPRVTTTSWGKETLGNIASEHDTIQNLKTQIPEGFEIENITVGGGKQNHLTAKRRGGEKDLAAELKTGYGLTPGQIQNPISVIVGKREKGVFAGDHKGDLVQIEKGDGKGTKVLMSAAEYERFGGKYSPETAAARGAETEPARPTPISKPTTVRQNGVMYTLQADGSYK